MKNASLTRSVGQVGGGVSSLVYNKQWDKRLHVSGSTTGRRSGAPVLSSSMGRDGDFSENSTLPRALKGSRVSLGTYLSDGEETYQMPEIGVLGKQRTKRKKGTGQK